MRTYPSMYTYIYIYKDCRCFSKWVLVKVLCFDVWLPSLGHQWPGDIYVPMNVRGKSLHGSSWTV